TITDYAWEFVSKPASSTATLEANSSGQASFVADIAGAYIVGLTVTDSQSRQDSAQATITAVAAPKPFRAELSWPAQYGEVDMDIHVVDATGIAGSGTGGLWNLSRDCNFETCKTSQGAVLDWGVPGYAAD